MRLKLRTRCLLAAAVLFVAAWVASCAGPEPYRPNPQPAKPAMPDDVVSVAQAAFGPEAEALAWGDFPNANGRQVLAVNRLAAVPSSGSSPDSAQNPVTTADVIRVSILVREETNWKEAFHADEHLKNRRGYLDRMPIPVSGWRMNFEKTPDAGFRLEFTPLNLPPGTKPETIRVAWNPKRKEYDSLDASGNRFLEPLPTPGGAPVKTDKRK